MIQKIGMILMLLCVAGCNSVGNEEQKIVQKLVENQEPKSVQNEETTLVYSFTGESEDFSLYTCQNTHYFSCGMNGTSVNLNH